MKNDKHKTYPRNYELLDSSESEEIIQSSHKSIDGPIVELEYILNRHWS